MLLSEREADAVHACLTAPGAPQPCAALVSLAFLHAALDRGDAAAALMTAGDAGALRAVDAAAVACARLFSGAASYPRTGRVYGELRRAVEGRKAGAEALLAARSCSEQFVRSDLEAACEGRGP